MNNFIKQISSKIVKPTKRIVNIANDITLKVATISFDFDKFYYSNEHIFSKPTNSIDDIAKSWVIMESFTYEKYVLSGILKILKKISYVMDVFFIATGWLLSIDHPPNNNHMTIKIMFSGTMLIIRNKVMDYLSNHNVLNITVTQHDTKLNINSFITPLFTPSVVISFFPFNIDYILIVVFFGIYNDTYCGISYTSNKENLGYIIEVFKPLVNEINILTDDITRFVSVKLFDTDSSTKKKFPDNTIYSICEIVRIFDKTKFEEPGVVPPLININTFIYKKIVSLIDLPSNIDIRACSRNGIDYITHIDNKPLNTILIIAKDDFLKSVSFNGTFKKENIIWKGNYSYRILESTFDTPTLKVSTHKRVCRKHAFNNTTYTTRSGSYII